MTEIIRGIKKANIKGWLPISKKIGQRVGSDRTHLVAPRDVTTGGSDGSCSPAMKHSTKDSVCYTSFGVRSCHSTPFTTEWNVRKASMASFTLDRQPDTFAPPMVRLTMDIDNGM
ncbi:hypothetical protein TNCV_455581 [Trichonephila clavipes]|nr:hypothetical protein TNCV_455581 [Trichonephila clavipes]